MIFLHINPRRCTQLIKSASNSKDLKVLNRISVLNTIRNASPIARYEVAKATNLTPPTVTVIVNDLIEKGLVREIGRGESSGGRRPVMLELNNCARYILAVRIQHGEMIVALLDLASNIVENQYQKLDTSRPETVVSAIVGSFNSIITDCQINKDKVLWCAVASPGLINSLKGTVEHSSNLKWGCVDLGEMISERLNGIPVHVENISNAAALGEKMYGKGYGCSNLIYLNLSVGIGAGIIINDQLFIGAKGYAGEIGKVGIRPRAGSVNRDVSQYESFEEICGVLNIFKKIKEDVPQEIFEDLKLSKDQIRMEEIFLPPLINVPEIKQILLEASVIIGMKIAELISLFNTDVIILGGEWIKAEGLLLDNVIKAVKENTFKEMGESIKIVTSSMQEDPPLMGVYALVLEKLFSFEEWTRSEA
jgi:predicted NBD/HSP70 family sugar kinase